MFCFVVKPILGISACGTQSPRAFCLYSVPGSDLLGPNLRSLSPLTVAGPVWTWLCSGACDSPRRAVTVSSFSQLCLCVHTGLSTRGACLKVLAPGGVVASGSPPAVPRSPVLTRWRHRARPPASPAPSQGLRLPPPLLPSTRKPEVGSRKSAWLSPVTTYVPGYFQYRLAT